MLRVIETINPLTAEWALRALIDFTLSNARRFSSSMGNPLDGKGLIEFDFMIPIQTGKVVEKTKPSIKDITAHKPRKYQLDSTKKKHQVLLLATPSNISSLRRLKSDSKRVSNKLREAAADRQGIHRLMSRHPFNILLKNMEFPLSRPYSSHKPKHHREFTPVAYHSDYQRAPWHHLRYRSRHPLLYALMPVNRYGPLLRNGYRHYFKQYALPWYGGMPWHRRFPNQYAFVSRPGLGLGYNSMLRHGTIGK